MAKVRRQYRLTSLGLDELNFTLAQIADRLDQMEGYRGTPQFQTDVDLGGNKGINAGDAVSDTDLTTKGQSGDAIDVAVALALTQLINNIWEVGGLFISTLSTNPRTLLGVGTWTQVNHGDLMIQESPYAPYLTVYIWKRTA